MRLHRTEKFFIAFLMLLVGAAVCAYWANSVVSGAFDGQSVPEPVASGIAALQLQLGLLISALMVGIVVFYPMIRRQAHEHGQWREKAESMEMKSQTFQRAALTDPMTGLQNRRYFDDALAQYMEEFSRIERPLGIMILDIDKFKSINDTHGHDIGDEVIKGLADTIRDYTRHHDITARMGGEEFAIVAPNVALPELEKMANRLRLAVSSLVFNLGNNVRLKITISVGIAVWDGKETGGTLYKRADENLYAAKRGGRNRVCA
ncbi:GGDEF domain-containing protein [Oricola sp.]|uniref:GGDEF domain-containing protein n=1 Tax=Oricola sp. TaxID=1979950 RepID=UPI0025D7EEB1|nr:GGDEF domain-containing protein [Oricola sp.]MCI5075702.1 GGDEF domain-containing protein [Oricola sp.]